MLGICVEKINQLLHHQMIWTDEDSFLLKPQGTLNSNKAIAYSLCQEQILGSLFSFFWFSEPGRLMTKYYLKFDTMKHIMKAPEKCSLEDALRIICHAEEINCMQIHMIAMCSISTTLCGMINGCLLEK